jgi:hypothetical protein
MLTRSDPSAAGELPRADEMPRAGHFPDRLGDLIDDRIAELLDEREAETGPRPRPGPAVAVLLIALTASVVLRHSVLAGCLIWPSTAVVYLTATRAGMRRS